MCGIEYYVGMAPESKLAFFDMQVLAINTYIRAIFTILIIHDVGPRAYK